MKDMDKQQILFAEQQLTGFCHAVNGGDVVSLIESMGLTASEWYLISCNDGISFPADVTNEINDYFYT